MPEEKTDIRPDMKVLDIISDHRDTEAVFKRYDERAGECICCQALFDTVEDVAKKYNLNISELMADLREAVEGSPDS